MSIDRHVVFAGAYGTENTGDDAPLLVMAEGLRRRHPDVRFRFTVLARRADPLIESAAAASFIPNPEYDSREAAAGKWFRGFNFGDDRADLARIDETIRDADLVVAGAGNVLIDLAFDLFRGPIPLLASYAFMADLHRTPLMLYGITAGPIKNPHARTLSAWIARSSAVATCRDEASAELLREIDPGLEIEVHPDPVLGLVPASDTRFDAALAREGLTRESSRPRLAVAWRDLDFLGFDRCILIDALRALSEEYALLFIPQTTGPDGDDRELAQEIVASLGDAEVRAVTHRHSPEVLMRFYELAEVTLAARLHGAVFSTCSGTPVAALAYLPKVSSFMETVGLSASCVDIEDATAASLVAAVGRARQVDGARLASRTQRVGEAVSAYLEHASTLLRLDDRASPRPHHADRKNELRVGDSSGLFGTRWRSRSSPS